MPWMGQWEQRARVLRTWQQCQQGVEDAPFVLLVGPLYGQVRTRFPTCSRLLRPPCASSCSRNRCSCLLMPLAPIVLHIPFLFSLWA